MIKAIIFDLDLTIFDSLTISDLMEAGLWEQVYIEIPKCRFYDNIANIIKHLRKHNIKVLIFTNSPKQYTKKVLIHGSIEVDYIIAYHDVQNHKPNPEGIYKAMRAFRLANSEIIYIGNSNIDLQTALNAGIPYFHVEWGEFVQYPNLNLINYSNFIEILQRHQFLLNIPATIDISLNNNNFKEQMVLKSELNKYFLGYYRHDKDNIKTKILEFKNGDSKITDEWLSVISYNIKQFPYADYIVRALGHNELTAHESNLDKIGKLLENEFKSTKYIPTLLVKKSLNEKLTSMNSFERKNILEKQYYCNQDVLSSSNRKLSFLIIDDVHTTGSTTKEITRAIRETFPNAIVNIFTLVQTKSFSDCKEIEVHNQILLAHLDRNVTTSSEQINSDFNNFENKKYSANYSYTNHNFVIQNLVKTTIASDPNQAKFIPAIFILKNILQRGKPTLTSKYLQTQLGEIHKDSDFYTPKALIAQQSLKWKRTIRGDVENNYFPAEKFLYDLWPKYFKSDYAILNNLILPEVRFEDITFVVDENLKNKQVDFYLPQASLIIEIDGNQHENNNNDIYRDHYLSKFGLHVIRIKTNDLELENNTFINSISAIRTIITDRIEEDNKRQLTNNTFIRLGDYLNLTLNTDSNHHKATAIIRAQLLILELLERGLLSFNGPWEFEIRQHDIGDFIHIAISDIFIWLDNLLKLHKIKFKEPKVNVTVLSINQKFSSKTNSIKIDFSLLQRYTDEFQNNPHIIYVRNDYFDQYKYFNNQDGVNLNTVQYKDVDYFKISTIDPINYSLSPSKNSSSYKSLQFMLENIFLQHIPEADFREGQYQIIINALMRNDTIGLLPTGSGKSICYQLACILQPSISFVVCPIKSLMYDQKDDLDRIFFSRTNYITSDLESHEKTFIQKEFAYGKYFFIFISPERFQNKSFREEFNSINIEKSFAYAVIDEVHCLSEWGHDFRTSYLNLANIISKLATHSSYIGLTATASINVLRDIQNEFNIEDIDVKTPSSFTREELSFNVIDDKGSKFDSLVKKLNELNLQYHVLKPHGNESKCGIIFTPHVNGARGCYDLANLLSNELDIEVGYYSGKKPRNYPRTDSEYDNFKRDIQNKFKSNDFTLLTATKAFGMGINKGNIFYTIHYGLPNSMESFYQEGGRAGRDKLQFTEIKAQCTVLLTPENDDDKYKKIWDPEIKLTDLTEERNNLSNNGDLNSNFYMLTKELDTINNEFQLINQIYKMYYSQDYLIQIIQSQNVGGNRQKVEKAIYRLSQLGIVDDWTVENFFNGIYEVKFRVHTDVDIENSLLLYIRKYVPEFEINEVKNNMQHEYVLQAYAEGRYNSTEKYFLILLIWTYQHFVGNRKQSLKNVYENCKDFTLNKINSDELKQRLENYFKIDKTSHSLQYIADNPNNYQEWFNIFFKTINGNVSNELISKSKRQQLKDQLSRFLESYINVSSLNFISGIVRLYENEFEDSDGKARLISSFNYIKAKFEEVDQLNFINNLLNFRT